MPTSICLAYIRVSSSDNRQDLGLAVQEEALNHCDQVFMDKDSGDHFDRPQLTALLDRAKELAKQGKSVSIWVYKLDRLTRSMFHLLHIIEELILEENQK